MTRKHFVMLAAALAQSKPPRGRDPLGTLLADTQHARDCTAVADVLAQDNPRFDRARFLKACGVSE